MGSSQHKSPHKARTLRLNVVTSAEISPSPRTNDFFNDVARILYSIKFLDVVVFSRMNIYLKRQNQTEQ